MTYDDTNKGVLFHNQKESDKHPDMKGKINIEGKEYELAAWRNQSKSGKPYMSLKASLPYNKENSTQDSVAYDESTQIDDEIRF